LSEEKLLPILGAQLNMPAFGEADLPVDPAVHLNAIRESGLPADWWVDQDALPWMEDGVLWVAAKDPLMTDLQEFVHASFGDIPIRWALIASQALERAGERVRHQERSSNGSPSDEVSHLRELAEEAPVIELVSSLITQAFEEQ